MSRSDGPRASRLLLLLVVVTGPALWLRLGPIDGPVLDQTRFASATVLDRNGVVLYEPLSAAGTRGEAVGELPANVVAATVAAEDRRFWWHPGVDPIALVRAAAHDVRHLRIVEGGSTLTQQVAKLLLQSPDRSVVQKVRESVLALRLEHRFTKRQILAMYLNLAPYGKQVRGISRASRAYFGCSPEELTAAQAAYLAALPQRPSVVAAARDRQLSVLRRMHLAPADYQRARHERLQFRREMRPLVAQHFVERVLESCGRCAGRQIRTTLDAGLQREVQGIIAANRDTLLAHGANAVAVAVLDNRSGQWLAWEGSGDWSGTSFGGAIDGVVTPRQPGSTLKPFTYALAFENGASPATVLPDIPSSFPTAEEGVVYTPRNYDGRYRGPMRVRAALAGSENVPAVAMLARLRPASLLRLLRAAGFDTLGNTADHYGLGLTLGDAEVRLDQLVAAYAAFARGGRQVTPTFILDSGPPRRERQLVSRRTAFWISDILSDPSAREFIFGSGGSLDFPFTVAAKTGTSQAYRDNWTIGFTREVTVGVWAGNFDRAQLRGSTGVTGAAPVFNAVMLAATRRIRGEIPVGDDAPVLVPPPDLERVEVCALSGLRPSPFCPAVQGEWLRRDAPAEFCSWHHDGYTAWPAEYRGWARTLDTHAAAPLPSRRARLRVTNPPDGATYLIDPTLRAGFQALRLRAVAASAVTWKVDGRRLGTTAAESFLEWPLVPGRHDVTATGRDGDTDRVQIFVK